ncbi:hypothetical protein B0J13DRAFT_551112 [Dactylonectria estremocensis]|uniref:Transmembrane protein n=1 Tax=Dactylonectria estremocensis TaxID=1079267 RepID=A0A9P9J9I9_9HYPO|nr:hypothetical protein B0J13DRAFT_551112 [Dactylonectria estremocensis]
MQRVAGLMPLAGSSWLGPETHIFLLTFFLRLPSPGAKPALPFGYLVCGPISLASFLFIYGSRQVPTPVWFRGTRACFLPASVCVTPGSEATPIRFDSEAPGVLSVHVRAASSPFARPTSGMYMPGGCDTNNEVRDKKFVPAACAGPSNTPGGGVRSLLRRLTGSARMRRRADAVVFCHNGESLRHGLGSRCFCSHQEGPQNQGNSSRAATGTGNANGKSRA